MKRKLQETFALTEKGVRGMMRASIASFCVNITYMAAMMAFFAFAQDLLADGKLSHLPFYLLAMVVIVVLMYLALDFEYRATYNTTYAESRDLRIAIADTMKGLPLGYFAKHDLSDLAQTMMQDVLDMEHAFSHAVPQAIGAGIFLVIMLIMILISHFWIGLAILIPTAVGFAIILLSKRYQKSFVKKFYDQS